MYKKVIIAFKKKSNFKRVVALLLKVINEKEIVPYSTPLMLVGTPPSRYFSNLCSVGNNNYCLICFLGMRRKSSKKKRWLVLTM